MKKIIFYVVILNFILSGTNLFAQNEGTKPLMKISVKDGKVVKAEPYDSTKRLFKIFNSGQYNNFNPDKAIRSSMNEDPRYNPNQAIRSSSFEPSTNSLIEKGNNFPEKIEYSKEILDLNSVVKINSRIHNDKRKTLNNKNSKNIKSLAGWEDIITEDFEGAFPGTDWNIYASSGYTDAYWTDEDYRAYSGYWGGYCAGDGTQSVTPGLGVTYPNNMRAWMIYGPFDLGDANDASLTFMNWNNSETNYDYFKYMASIDGTTYYGNMTSGNSLGWVSKSLDFKNIYTLGDITGEPQVWIAFIFTSDVSNSYEGSYIDDIVLKKNTVTVTLPDLTWTNMSLSTSSWTVGSSVTADLTEVNNGTGSAAAHSTRLYLSTNTAITSLDTQLGTDLSYGSIVAGGSQIQSKTFTVPDVTDGTYYVGAIVDYYDVVPESDETNNALYRLGQVTTVHSLTTYNVYGKINNFVGGTDADADGYYESYTFQIGIDGDAIPGPATVYGKMICTTTGQSWWSTASWSVTGSAIDYVYFNFSQADFAGYITGNTNLDFTVELWNSTKTTLLATDASVTGEPVKADYIGSGTSQINVTPTSLAFGNVQTLTTSTPQTYTVSGTSLTANISITAPTGYQVCTTSGGTYSNTLTLTQTAGTVSATTIYVKFSPTAVQAYNGNIAHSSTGATTQNVAVTGSGITCPSLPTAPTIGTITQPTCTVATGSVVLSGLPATGNWTINPGSITGTGISSTITGLASGTYTYTVTNASGCTSAASANVVINAQPATPTAPTPGTITQPTCTVATGSVVLSGLPATGTWTLTITPGGTTTTGTGTSTTISALAAGTYTWTVTNASGCTSVASANVVINAQPATPTAPTAGTITHPTCTVATGSVVLNGLPATGTWTLTRTPGGTTSTGTGTSTTISTLASGTYTWTVTNASGCTSVASANVVINAQPTTPTAPTTNAATNFSQTIFTANWSGSTTATGYRLDVATDNGFSTFVSGYSDKDLSNVTTYSVTGLTANTTYYYRVRAYNACGASPNSGTITATTLPNPPSAPSASAATTIVQTSFVANWNSSATATGYRLDVATDNGFTTFLSGYNDKDVSNITTCSVTGLIANTTYYYRIRAYNTGGASLNSITITVTTLPNPPSAPSASAATTIVQTSFTAKWNTSATSTGYRLDVATNSGFTTFVTGFTDKDVSNVTTYNITGLSAKTIYYYRVRAYNTGGNSPNSNTITVTTLTNPSSVPTGLTASSCNDLVTLKWKKSTGPDFIRYRIYRGTTSNPTTKTDSTTNSISDTIKIISGLTRGQTYYFRVTAVNYDGAESSFSDQSTAVVKTGVVPRVKAKWSDLLICYNQGDSIKSFQWYKGSTTITGETKQYYKTNKVSGVYKVETIDLNGCKNSSIPIQIPIAGAKSLSVYPNPASVSFALKINDESEGRAVVSLLNSAGIKVMEFQAEILNNELLQEIPVNNLDEGIYVVQVLLNQKDLYYSKIVVIK